jgi:hypothetical protein
LSGGYTGSNVERVDVLRKGARETYLSTVQITAIQCKNGRSVDNSNNNNNNNNNLIRDMTPCSLVEILV